MKAAKLAGAGIAALVLITAAVFALAVWLGERKLARTIDVKVVPVAFAKDPASLKLGRYLFEARGCAECHAADGHGLVFIDDASGLYVKSPDITPGPGGVVAEYAEADWVRTIRHGVSPAGHPLISMPSDDFNRMSDADIAAVVAYARSLAPVAGSGAEIHLPLLMKALYGIGIVRDAADKIDHRLPPLPAVAPGATPAYGEYVVQMCVGCHRADFGGGPVPGGMPDWPPAPRLAPGPGSVMARYDTPARFAAMMRSGRRPDGSAVSAVMPFTTLRNLSDTDLDAIYAYLSALPPAVR